MRFVTEIQENLYTSRALEVPCAPGLDGPISCLPHTDTSCSSCFSSSSGRRGHWSRLFGCLALCHPSVSALFIWEECGHLGFLSLPLSPGQAGHVAQVWAETPGWWFHTMSCRSPLTFSSSTAVLCTSGTTEQEIKFSFPIFFKFLLFWQIWNLIVPLSVFLDLAPFMSCNTWGNVLPASTKMKIPKNVVQGLQRRK